MVEITKWRAQRSFYRHNFITRDLHVFYTFDQNIYFTSQKPAVMNLDHITAATSIKHLAIISPLYPTTWTRTITGPSIYSNDNQVLPFYRCHLLSPHQIIDWMAPTLPDLAMQVVKCCNDMEHATNGAAISSRIDRHCFLILTILIFHVVQPFSLWLFVKIELDWFTQYHNAADIYGHLTSRFSFVFSSNEKYIHPIFIQIFSSNEKSFTMFI